MATIKRFEDPEIWQKSRNYASKNFFIANQNFKNDLFKLLDYLLNDCEIKIFVFAYKDM